MESLTGRLINNRYRVDELIGEGGMSRVYKVWDNKMAVFLAMKVLRDDLTEDKVFLRRFKREAQTLEKLQHPHIVHFYRLEQHDDLVFILMDYIEGHTLRKELAQSDRPFEMDRVMKIMRAVCSALHYAHQNGMVHCDIKPANIMIQDNGTVMVTDFGIARQAEGATTTTMAGAGTPAYMAPEQIHEEDPIPQSDIYALGIVLYEMLTGGERPFTGEMTTIAGSTGEKVRWEQVNLKPLSPKRFNPQISEELALVVLKCLEKEPEQRYSEAQDLLTALQNSLGLEKQQEIGLNPDPIKLEQPAASESKEPGKPVKREKQRPVMTGKEIVERRQGWLWWVGLGMAGLLLVFLGIVLGKGVGGILTINTPTPELGVGSTQTREKDGMVMVYIPSGPFMMGSDHGDVDEKPERRETLPAYWIDETEVTNEMYEKCEQEGKCRPPVKLSSYTRERYYGNTEFADYPVIYVDWNMARTYCDWVGGRLPSEAEWEKAARGTDGWIYPWGDSEPDSSLANYGNMKGDSTRVGKYPDGASPYGAMDMAGNVWEWVADWYDVYPGGDPTASSYFGTEYRVLRGGSWYITLSSFRAAIRIGYNPSSSSDIFGFRCALSLP